MHDPVEQVRPLLLKEPLAPWVAAARGGTQVDLQALDAAFQALCAGRDAVLVEGAGGLLVPLTRDLAFDGLFVQWDLDLVVVAGNRLGAINHTLLTVRAAHDAGLRVRGVVLNTLDPEPPGIAESTNLETLRGAAGARARATLPLAAQAGRRPLRARALAEECGFAALIAERGRDS